VNNIRLVLAIAAVVIHGTAFFFYVKQMKLGQSRPNIVTWGIDIFLMLLNTLTFREMSRDTVATAQFFVGTVGCVIIFLYALVRGKFSEPGRTGWWAMLLGIIAAITWYVFREVTWANMIVLVALSVAFVPTWDGAYRDPFKETPRSWVMWTMAYLITTVNVLLNPTWRVVSLVNSIVSMFAHGLVAVLSTKKRKCKFVRGRS